MKKIIVQPYYNYEGHFRHYTDNLVNLFDEIYIPRVVKKLKSVPDKKFLLKFLIWKIYLSLMIYIKLTKIRKASIVQLVDFEPIAFLTLSTFISQKIRFIITIHSAQASKGVAQRLQKKFLYYVLLKISKKFQKCIIVVHDEEDRKILCSKIPGLNVVVISYPGIDLNLNRTTPRKDIIIYGALRLDKDPIEILRMCNNIDQQFIHIGRVDRDIENEMKNIKYSNKYVSQNELKKSLTTAKYLLMPYGPSYAGGAGPLKDAIVNLIPMIAHKNFKYADFILQHGIGHVFSNSDELAEFMSSINEAKYRNLLSNLVKIKDDYTWKKMNAEYESLLKDKIN